MVINILKRKNFTLILLSLLPCAFVIGPFAVELIVNILNIFFLVDLLKKKKLNFLKKKIVIFFLGFYIFLLFSLLNSQFISENILNIFFYLRFILFPFAIFEIISRSKENLKILFIFLLLTMIIVIIDGYIQFFFERNILGYEKYRADRISGFFKDDLILGSFLSRILPLLIGLALYFKKDLNLYKLSILTIISCIILIFLSGERAAFFKTLLGLIMIFLILGINWKIKGLIITFVFTGLITIVFSSQSVHDRYINQLKIHLIGDKEKNIAPLSYYLPMFQTSLKMFDDSKLIGKGPKTYRYHCADKKFVSYFPDKYLIDNSKLVISIPWKEKKPMVLEEIFVSTQDIIKKGDKIFSFKFLGDEKINIYYSDKEGLIKKIFKEERIIHNHIFLNLEPQNSPLKEYVKRNSCNTHPHNFYIQLLGETGIIGFLFIFSLFIYIAYLLIKNLFYKIHKSPKKLSDSELILLIGFFLAIFPLSTNGNFFNNWINLISFYPFGFYLYLNKIRNVE